MPHTIEREFPAIIRTEIVMGGTTTPPSVSGRLFEIETHVGLRFVARMDAQECVLDVFDSTGALVTEHRRATMRTLSAVIEHYVTNRGVAHAESVRT